MRRAGGKTVQIWVAQIDEAAARNTRDVDILLRRQDLPLARAALEQAGFTYRHAASVTMFLDGENATARDALYIVFADEKVRPDYVEPSPSVDESTQVKDFRALNLDALVRMKLTSYRDKDRTHLRDMLEVGLIDASWLPRFQTELRQRFAAFDRYAGGLSYSTCGRTSGST
jgi:hypothetical protein